MKNKKLVKIVVFQIFDMDINLKELYLLSKMKRGAGYSHNIRRRKNYQ